MTMTFESQQQPPASSNAKKRIFIVEDHPIFRRGLANLIESDPEFTVCGHAASFPDALDKLRSIEAHAAVLDVAIEGANGLELVKHLRAEHPHLALLVLSVHNESVYGPRALRAGAQGYVMKREADDVFLQAIHKVLAGEVYVSPALAGSLLYRVVFHNDGDGKPQIASLSDRELEVLDLIGQGMPSREIAEKLHISVKTVETHRLHIKEKLGLPHASEVVRFAIQWAEEQKAV
jgi:DNA-binding NarL/FixJ family response regulator